MAFNKLVFPLNGGPNTRYILLGLNTKFTSVNTFVVLSVDILLPIIGLLPNLNRSKHFLTTYNGDVLYNVRILFLPHSSL